MVFLVAALMVLAVAAALGGSALALTKGQLNACAKHAENNGDSYAKGIKCPKIEPMAGD